MMKKLMSRVWEKKDSKKGFTLVELIVVLVILGILAAILVPSLIGWINKAKEKQTVLEARNAYLAVQTVIFERGAHTDDKYTAGVVTLTDAEETEVAEISQLPIGNFGTITINASGVVTDFIYTSDTTVCTYSAAGWNITKAPATT